MEGIINRGMKLKVRLDFIEKLSTDQRLGKKTEGFT